MNKPKICKGCNKEFEPNPSYCVYCCPTCKQAHKIAQSNEKWVTPDTRKRSRANYNYGRPWSG